MRETDSHDVTRARCVPLYIPAALSSTHAAAHTFTEREGDPQRVAEVLVEEVLVTDDCGLSPCPFVCGPCLGLPPITLKPRPLHPQIPDTTSPPCRRYVANPLIRITCSGMAWRGVTWRGVWRGAVWRSVSCRDFERAVQRRRMQGLQRRRQAPLV